MSRAARLVARQGGNTGWQPPRDSQLVISEVVDGRGREMHLVIDYDAGDTYWWYRDSPDYLKLGPFDDLDTAFDRLRFVA